jgi:hypothetical protein
MVGAVSPDVNQGPARQPRHVGKARQRAAFLRRRNGG